MSEIWLHEELGRFDEGEAEALDKQIRRGATWSRRWQPRPWPSCCTTS